MNVTYRGAMKWFRTTALFLSILAFASPAAAHPAPFSYMDVRLQQPFIEISLVVHSWDIAHELGVKPVERVLDRSLIQAREDAIRKLIASRLNLEADGRPLTAEWGEYEIMEDRQSIRFNLRYAVDRLPGSLAVDTLMFPYDPVHQTFVNVYERGELTSQMILDRNRTRTEYFAGTRQGVLAVIARFVPSGIHHILIGPDHILFLIGLLLLGGPIRKLVLVVTSFTIAHSVTLSLAALNLLNPPASIIEPAIALSVVYVGADNLLAQGGRDVRAWIALAFGFIHGFGFANVLREMGLPSRALGWSLFSFNFGVEIGQLLIVIVVASALAALRRKSEWAGRRIVFAGSLIVIAAGSFWFIERVFFSGNA
jgi:hydrogenase/urease accessory protein HupE